MSSCARFFLLAEDVNLLPVIHAGVEDLCDEVRLLLRRALLALHAHDFLSRGTLAPEERQNKKQRQGTAVVALVRDSRWWVCVTAVKCARARVRWWGAQEKPQYFSAIFKRTVRISGFRIIFGFRLHSAQKGIGSKACPHSCHSIRTNETLRRRPSGLYISDQSRIL